MNGQGANLCPLYRDAELSVLGLKVLRVAICLLPKSQAVQSVIQYSSITN